MSAHTYRLLREQWLAIPPRDRSAWWAEHVA